MKPLILSAAIVAALTVSGTAQELCIQPIRPEAAHLLDAGFSGAEVRVEFRRYFNEIEDYLNCLNAKSGRIRGEARSAAYDYQHVLETTELGDAGQVDDEFQPPSVAMKDTGELFLYYRPNTGGTDNTGAARNSP